MEYSAGMVSCLFWFVEMRKTAKYMLEGLSKEEIKKIAIEDNIYQVDALDRKNRILGATYKRLKSLPDELIDDVLNSDVSTSKILVLISIMKTDKLFFEFMHEVFRSKIILGENKIEDKDLNIFFDEKIKQSEKVAGFSETAIKKLKHCYVRILFEAGLLSSSNTYQGRNIIPIHINYKIREILKKHNMSIYINSITGEA